MRPVLLSALAVFLFPALGRAGDNPPSYVRDVQPLLQSYCARCHKPGKTKGRLDVTTYAKLLRGGKKGRGVVPGDPGRSWVVRTMEGHRPVMPPRREKQMRRQEIAVIRAWVAAGAVDDTPRAD